jgi:hypothetical protein
MPCTGLPDVCQPDPNAPGYFHQYDWRTIDGSGCTDQGPNSSAQWFCWGKKVAFELFGISGTPANGNTPTYIWDSSWITVTATAAAKPGNSPYLFQDVANTLNAPGGCGGYSGVAGTSYQIPTGTTFTGDTSNPTNVTVSWTSNPFHGGETIWLNPQFSPLNPHPNFDVTTPHGAIVTSVVSGTSFTYVGLGPDNGSGNSTGLTQIITAPQSWPVPYEAPYAAAWLSFLKAAIYHFNNLNVTSNQTLSNIGYIRPGVARGGEAIPLCTISTVMGSSYANFSQPTWESWYATVNSTVQAANPQMQIVYSINAGDPQRSDASYATDEAMIAVGQSNGVGQFNGFGSQGLQQSDVTNGTLGFQPANCPDGTNPPDTANNWGCMFAKYWPGSVPTGSMTASPTTVPLELQQIDCSNPCAVVTGNCTNQGLPGDTCMQGGVPGKTQDLRTLYPFTTQNHVSILELYNQDALLAFDPNYCLLVSSACSSTGVVFPTLTAGTQFEFFQDAGIGNTNNCYTSYITGMPQTGANGDCSYAAAIYAAHGYH